MKEKNKCGISMGMYRTKRNIFWLILLIIMLFIFWFSNQDENISKKLSDVVGQHILSDGVIKRAAESEKSISVMPLFAGLSIRKFAHVLLYAILGIFSAIAVDFLHIRDELKVGLPFLICLLYAAFDEIHQAFIPGRTALVKDIIIDAMGFIPSILLTLMIMVLLRKK